jgi:hypothetical protein
MTERQLKLEKIVNELDELYGVGNGYIYDDTDVDIFIAELINLLTKTLDLGFILDNLNESRSKSYLEMLNEI